IVAAEERGHEPLVSRRDRLEHHEAQRVVAMVEAHQLRGQERRLGKIVAASGPGLELGHGNRPPPGVGEPRVSASGFGGGAVLGGARAIAFPRYPGTEGCRRAQAIIAGWFRSAGLAVSEEPFRYDIRPAMRAIRIVAATGGVLLAAAGIVATRSPGWALALAAG